jgi:mannose-6-phosphate isomerase-like protein (cupin superfamily)
MDTTDRSRVIRLVDAEAPIPGPADERAVLVLQRDTLDITLSIPIPPNQQTPHEQDELYVVIRGRGVLVHDDQRNRFDSGDILFVAAGVEHHYEDFSDDLALVAHILWPSRWRTLRIPPRALQRAPAPTGR